MKRRYLFIAILCNAALWLFWISFQRQASSLPDVHTHAQEGLVVLTQSQIEALGIETLVAGPGQLSMTLSARGKIILHPDKIARILPKISGVANKALKNMGDRVEIDEIVAVLESREMADIKANYLAAKEKAILAASLLAREKNLYEKKVSAQQDYILAQSTYAEAKIQLQLAKQKLQAFGLSTSDIEGDELRLYDIRSPMAGTVIARHINKGQFVENTATIYEIVDLSTVWIEMGIYPKDLAQVEKGQMVNISLPQENTQVQAKILYLSPIIQDETITATAIAELENFSEQWHPGAFVQVNIATKNVKASLVIPKKAIQEIDGQTCVFVKTPQGFEKRAIQIGLTDDEQAEVLSGLNSGQAYASSKTFLLKADLNKEEAEHSHG